jgi:hypothetical protein
MPSLSRVWRIFSNVLKIYAAGLRLLTLTCGMAG